MSTRTILAALSVKLFVGCAATAIQPAPTVQVPTFDSRLMALCPDTYSTLTFPTTWDAVQAARQADIAQAESCRINHQKLVEAILSAQALTQSAAKQPTATK